MLNHLGYIEEGLHIKQQRANCLISGLRVETWVRLGEAPVTGLLLNQPLCPAIMQGDSGSG